VSEAADGQPLFILLAPIDHSVNMLCENLFCLHITPLAIAASAGELIFTARYEYLETVKHSLAYWTLKVPIGTAAAKRLLDGTSNGSRIEPAYPKRPARPMEALKGLALLSRGRAVNETRRTEIPSSSGMGSLASNSAY
jgi:hypothetical protein